MFYNVAANAEVNNPAVCGKHIIKDKTITVQCDFQEGKDHISTILSGSFEFSGSTDIENKNDIDWIHLSKLIIIKNDKISQEINLKSVETGIRIDGFDGAVKPMDLNFDGYDDIQLWTSPSAGIDSSYEYWLYNPKIGLFDTTDLGKKLSGFDIIPDAKTKTVSVKEHSGCCYNYETTYHWIDKELLRKSSLYYGVLVGNGCGQTTTHYNDNEEILREDIEPSDYCKGDEHNPPMSLKPYISVLRSNEKDGDYILKKKSGGKYTLIYKKPKKLTKYSSNES